jgi:hypothetical protein
LELIQTIGELNTLVKLKHCANMGKSFEVPKNILVIDLGGETWRKENLFGVSASRDIKCHVL